ncbi:ankyrin repeat domain-containing protein [Paenibacillus pini]|nr:ankyrin repeat domain-containing protein [Paenibacillus pini]
MNEKLIKSAQQGDTEKVLIFLQGGADINAIDERGRTAVMAATYNHHTNTVKALIEQGADVDKRDHNLNNVLLYAGAEGMIDILRLAIDAGANTKLTNRYGGTALIPASERGHVDVVQELLSESDTDVNHINNLHWTALLEAIILGDGGEKHRQIIELLLQHGADVQIADGDGVTPLQHAHIRGYIEIESMLKAAGATD